MIRPVPFLVLVGLLIGAIGYFSSYVPPGDPFAGSSGEIPIDLTTVPTSTVAALKIRHAASQPPFDIGLFGNSRILAVSSRNVGDAGCRLFNFALSGESIRASVALIEHLALIGKSPHIAIVGIDNFESQYFGNPTWLPAFERWRSAWADLAAGWQRHDVSMQDWLRMGWRHLHTEGESVRYAFARPYILAAIRHWLQGMPQPDDRLPADGSRGPHYRIDGSLPYEVAGKDVQADVLLSSAPEQIIVGYLRRDLQRLADLEKDGRRIIVYESPVAPVSARQFARQSSAYAKFHRETFLDECRRLGLSCRADPGVFAADANWRDSSHPPPDPLGAYIRSLISQTLPDSGTKTCGHDL